MKHASALVAVLLVAGCGQTGPLYLPPECSPLRADGSVVETFDEDGELLPPCPADEPEDEPAPYDENSDELDQDF